MLDGLYVIAGYAVFILLPLMAILGAHLALADYVGRRRGVRHPVLWLAGLSGLMSVVWPIAAYPVAFVEAVGAGEAGAGLATRPFEAMRGFFIFGRTVGLPYAMCEVLPAIAKVLPQSLCWVGGSVVVALGLFLLGLLALLPGRWGRTALITVGVSLALVITLYSWQGGELGDVLPRARSVPLYPGASQVEYIDESFRAHADLRILFRTTSSPEAVQTFYRDSLPAKGWQRTTGSVPLEFSRPPEEGDQRSVAVVATTAPSGSDTQVELTINETMKTNP